VSAAGSSSKTAPLAAHLIDLEAAEVVEVDRLEGGGRFLLILDEETR
jgi:hypothetical protein